MKIKTNEICLYGILGAVLFVSKFAMSFIPNVEPVSLLLIIYTLIFGMKAIYSLTTYVLLEFLIYGFGFWSIAYLYIWLILMIASIIISKITNNNMNTLLWASVSGMFGLIFGALYIPLYVVSMGFEAAIIWWFSGILFDVIHGVANFTLCIILFKPITNILSKLQQYKIN